MFGGGFGPRRGCGRDMILVLLTNLLVGFGLISLSMTMLRHPERVWVGIRVPRSPQEVARVRRANRWTAPWLLLLGVGELLSLPLGFLTDTSPLLLALGGLVILLSAILVISVAALLFNRGQPAG